jgi:hypothetical protein
MSIKTNSIVTLFVALIIILAVNPKIVNDIYSTILGRLFLIGIVMFFSIHNITLGLLVALTVITALNQFSSFVEGFESPVTIGEENVPITGGQKVLSNKQTISNLKSNAAAIGIDKEDIKNAIMSKDSKTIQLDPNIMKNDDVSAFNPNMLTKTSLAEGFCPYAGLVNQPR